MDYSVEKLCDIFFVLLQHHAPAPMQPTAEMRAQLIRTSGRRGLLMGINDLLSGWVESRKYQAQLDGIRKLKGAPSEDEEREKLNRALASKGLPTLLELELALTQKHQRIIARKKIKNDDEYYIVKEIVDGPMIESMTKRQQKLLGSIMAKYEASRKTA
jgi:hypothetical protein